MSIERIALVLAPVLVATVEALTGRRPHWGDLRRAGFGQT